MFKRSNIGKWLLLMIFVLILSSGSAGANDEQLDGSESADEDLPLTAYEPEAIAEIKKDPQFITSRGSFSEIVDDYEVMDFSNPVYICWSNVTDTDRFFSEFEAYVIGFCYAGAGFIIVELESDSSEKVNEATIDEIYQIIDNYCEQEGISEVPVVFMWSHIDEDLPLPDYGPQIFEKAEKSSGFVAARGTMPVITDASEKREWTDSLVQCSRTLCNPSHPDAGIGAYFVEFDGPVSSFGTSINGYLEVGFQGYSSEKVNESLIDEIYQVIDEQCEQEGISDIPVVFEFIGFEIEDIAIEPVDDRSDVDEAHEAANINSSNNEAEMAGNETTNEMPGFTSIMVILGLLILVKIKRN